MARRGTKITKKSLPPVTCKGCGMSFIPRDHRQHFHSVICREEFYQHTYYALTSARKVCPNCGSGFVTSKPGRQVYCTPECREDAKKKRIDGIVASVSAERKTFLGDRFAAIEKDDFKCVFCGKSVSDGVKLDVENDEKGGLRTVCNLCSEGRKEA